MKKPLFTGTCTALITPFSDTGVDTQALSRIVDWQIGQGVNALVACGTTGEPSTLEDDEWAKVVETVVTQAKGRVPVIAGTGGNNTAHVIMQAKRAKELGADAQLCVTPYYNKASHDGLIAHYRAIAGATDLPIIIYNVPSRTGLNLQPGTLAVLSEQEHIIAVKEASADMVRLADMMLISQDRLDFYSGADEVIVPLMALGGLGVISVISNIAPALTCELTDKMLAGNLREAAALQLKLMPLIHALFTEVNPIPVKAGMSMLEYCEDRLRLPLVPLTSSNRALLADEMRKLELLR
ncbi:MAG: 4-hydroxy-tetrahydrodipicolinate synthase [Eubacteriales bacterium]|nr:4-hydroxy-tetrahydrodipicolinate synthase [Eubacteriales bacterium]